MGQSVVLGELDPLGVDQDHADLFGCRAHENAGQHRVDAARLARSGLARHKEVGHVGQVDHDRPSGDVATETHFERVNGGGRLLGHEQIADGDQGAVDVRNLDADRLFARDRREDSHIGCGHRIRDVLLETRDAGDLHAGSQLVLEHRDRRADPDTDEAGLDVVLAERSFEALATFANLDFVDVLSSQISGEGPSDGRRHSPPSGWGVAMATGSATTGTGSNRLTRTMGSDRSSSKESPGEPRFVGDIGERIRRAWWRGHRTRLLADADRCSARPLDHPGRPTPRVR